MGERGEEQDVEGPLRRLEEEYASVDALVVVNEHGFPLHASGLPSEAAANTIARTMNELAHLSRNLVRDVDPDDNLVFLRLRCGKAEWVVGAQDDHLVVVHHNLRKIYTDLASRGDRAVDDPADLRPPEHDALDDDLDLHRDILNSSSLL